MKKEQVVKAGKIIFLIAFIIFLAINLFRIVHFGKQEIDLIYPKEAYKGEKLGLSVSAEDFETKDTLNSKTKVILRNSNNKKVKNVKTAMNQDDSSNIELELPKDLESRKILFRGFSKNRQRKRQNHKTNNN